MAEEMHVFFAGDVPSRTTLGSALRRLGWPFAIGAIETPLAAHSGFLPMTLRGEETGAELSFGGIDDGIRASLPNLNPALEHAAHLRGGSETEMVAALCLAAALADLRQGVVHDESGDRLLAPAEAVGVASQHFAALKPVNDGFGARQSDLRRHLWPLLALRKDLVFVDRALIVTPIRHIIRGAFLDRSSDRYEVVIRRFLVLPAANPHSLGRTFHDQQYLRTWQDQFHPLLLDTLSGFVFDGIDEFATLSGFAGAAAGDREGRRQDGRLEVLAYLLAGERELSEAAVERRKAKAWDPSAVTEPQELLERDSEELYATCHATEAASIRSLKLERFWEPTPFPAELPRQSRGGARDVSFAPAPWPARPANLIANAPETSGTMQFARSIQHRTGRVVAILPLSLDEAKHAWSDGRAMFACAGWPGTPC